MAERGAGAAAVRGALPAAAAGASRLLRSARARDPAGAGRPRAGPRRRRVLLLALLVSRHAPARTAVRRGAGLGAARLPLLSLVGQRNLVAALARHRRGGR